MMLAVDTLGCCAEEETGTQREFAFLSGPSFAKEIAMGLATAVTVASDSEALANETVELFANPQFKVFTSSDVTGIEIGGAVKNVIAISAGMCEGLGLGTNSMSALVTRWAFSSRHCASPRSPHVQQRQCDLEWIVP